MRAAFVDDSVYLCKSAKMLGPEIRRRVDQQLLIPRVVHSPPGSAINSPNARASCRNSLSTRCKQIRVYTASVRVK